MATSTQSEAQRLVSISLTKMAQSRTERKGISLHKSLLVATVLQKARYLCMEDLFRMVHVHSPVYQNNVNVGNEQQCYDFEDEDDNLIALTPEEAGITDQHSFADLAVGNGGGGGSSVGDEFTSSPTSANTADIGNECLNSAEYDKENLAPEAPTYFDLDKTPRDQQCFRERSSTITSSSSYCKNLKRRRAVCDSETEEAIQSILPKKTRTLSFDSDCEDSVFGDDDPFLGDTACEDGELGSKSMDIDRITSLVSIFSFGGLSPSSSVTNLTDSNNCNSSSTTPTSTISSSPSYSSLTRSSSTPDLCSAQAKESESLQQRPFIAMTV